MKKLFLLVLASTFALFGYSQQFYKVVKSTKCEFRDEKWVTVGTRIPDDEFVIINKTEITIATYKFKVYGEYRKGEYDTHTTYSWNCVNAEGNKCYFMMKIFKPEVTSHVLYSIVYDSGVMYEYETE